MDQSTILLEYLKEQYTQARQHETRQSTATSFVVAATGAVLGLTMREGAVVPISWWPGLVIFLLGAANAWINYAHFRGNRYHVKLAGKIRRELEDTCTSWSVRKPTQLREATIRDLKLIGSEISIGSIVFRALQIIPFGIMVVGLALFCAGLVVYEPSSPSGLEQTAPTS